MSILLKNRPRTANEIIGNDKGKRRVLKLSRTSDWNENLLIGGGSGTGKGCLTRVRLAMEACQNKKSNGDNCGECATCEDFIYRFGPEVPLVKVTLPEYSYRVYFADAPDLKKRRGMLEGLFDQARDHIAMDEGGHSNCGGKSWVHCTGMYPTLSYPTLDLGSTCSRETSIIKKNERFSRAYFVIDEFHRFSFEEQEQFLTQMETPGFRFILISSNGKNGLIEPVCQRLSKIETQAPNRTELITFLASVAKRENIEIERAKLERCAYSSCGYNEEVNGRLAVPREALMNLVDAVLDE